MGGHATDRLLGGRGRWWKFNRYEIKNGHITGAAGAPLAEYDPWKLYERSLNFKNAEPPYYALLELGRKVHDASMLGGPLDDVTRQPAAIGDSLADAILEFCQRYGLLGILPHQALQVSISPRVSDSNSIISALYLRGGGTWDLIGVPGDLGWDYRRWGAASTVILRYGPGGPIYAEGLTGYWSRFFPSVQNPDYFAFPLPLSEHFWELYSEPLDIFLKAVLWTGDMYAKESYPRQINLNALIDAVGIGVDDEGRYIWRSPSLLGYFALMFVMDMNGKRMPHECPSCGRLFKGDHRARYCGNVCAWREQKRRQRRRPSIQAAGWG
jgi:hypothetical protein